MFHLVRPGVTHMVAYLIALGFAVFVLVRFASWRSRQAKTGVEITFAKELVGRKAKAATDLMPSGHIHIDDQTYQALSQTGTICKGTHVKVVGGQGTHLIVEPHPEQDPQN